MWVKYIYWLTLHLFVNLWTCYNVLCILNHSFSNVISRAVASATPDNLLRNKKWPASQTSSPRNSSGRAQQPVIWEVYYCCRENLKHSFDAILKINYTLETPPPNYLFFSNYFFNFNFLHLISWYLQNFICWDKIFNKLFIIYNT